MRNILRELKKRFKKTGFTDFLKLKLFLNVALTLKI